MNKSQAKRSFLVKQVNVNGIKFQTKKETESENALNKMQIFKQKFETTNKQKAKVKKLGASKKQGTVVLFDPDPEIFAEIKFNWNSIIGHLRQQAYLVKGLEINILDLRRGKCGMG